MGNQEVTCIDTDWYRCSLKPMGMADLLAASRICFWGSNRVMSFVVLRKMKTLSLQDYGNHYFQICCDFLKLYVSFLWGRAFVWVDKGMRKNDNQKWIPHRNVKSQQWNCISPQDHKLDLQDVIKQPPDHTYNASAWIEQKSRAASLEVQKPGENFTATKLEVHGQ